MVNIAEGMIITGNINQAKMEIMKIEKGSVIIKDLKSKRKFVCGVEMVKHCDISVTPAR